MTSCSSNLNTISTLVPEVASEIMAAFRQVLAIQTLYASIMLTQTRAVREPDWRDDF